MKTTSSVSRREVIITPGVVQNLLSSNIHMVFRQLCGVLVDPEYHSNIIEQEVQQYDDHCQTTSGECGESTRHFCVRLGPVTWWLAILLELASRSDPKRYPCVVCFTLI
jgi:hypothetical protein